MKTRIERFSEKYTVDVDTGCWLWVGSKTMDGYGRFAAENKKIVSAHRWSYENFIGEIPKEMELDHVQNRCNPDRFIRRSCVNPDHLEPVTHLENMNRGANTYIKSYNARKTHCPHGHEYNKENTTIVTNKKKQTSRQCKTCRRKAVIKSYWKHHNKRLEEKREYKKNGPKNEGPSTHIGDFHKAKTHCPRGHEYAGDNLIITRVGTRSCRTCKNMLTRNRRQKQKVE